MNINSKMFVVQATFNYLKIYYSFHFEILPFVSYKDNYCIIRKSYNSFTIKRGETNIYSVEQPNGINSIINKCERVQKKTLG